MVPEIMYNALDTFLLMAIPFLSSPAQFMVKGGVTKYLNRRSRLATSAGAGRVGRCGRGRLHALRRYLRLQRGHGAAIGVIVIPAMMQYGYPRSFAAGVVAASGTMGS